MGFGSYDESEQKDTEDTDTDGEGVSVHENDHDGKLTFESEASTTDLVDQLEEIKDDGDEDDDAA